MFRLRAWNRTDAETQRKNNVYSPRLYVCAVQFCLDMQYLDPYSEHLPLDSVLAIHSRALLN